jgi:superfamily II DNA or RNA helicase
VKEVKHGYAIQEIFNAPFANGQDDITRAYIGAFNKGEVKGLIGTTGILGEGVDTKPCEYVIIAGLGKAKSAFMQQIGRAVRTYPGKESAKIILFRDASHRFTLRHYRAQAKILKEEYGVTPIKLELE